MNENLHQGNNILVITENGFTDPIHYEEKKRGSSIPQHLKSRNGHNPQESEKKGCRMGPLFCYFHISIHMFIMIESTIFHPYHVSIP